MVDVVFQVLRRFDPLLVFDCRYSFSSTVLIQLVETGCVLSSGATFSVYGHSAYLKLSQFELCSCRAQSVFGVCNAWLWGQLSFQTRTITREVVGNVN